MPGPSGIYTTSTIRSPSEAQVMSIANRLYYCELTPPKRVSLYWSENKPGAGQLKFYIFCDIFPVIYLIFYVCLMIFTTDAQGSVLASYSELTFYFKIIYFEFTKLFFSEFIKKYHT